MPDPVIPAAAATASEPAQPAPTGKTEPTAKPAVVSRQQAGKALDDLLEQSLSEEPKPAAEPVKEPEGGKATKTDDQPSGDSAKADETKDEPKDEPKVSVDDEPRVDFDEPKAKDEDEDDHKGGFPKDWPEAAVKNLLKEREKRKEARRVAEEASTKLTEREAKLKELEAENAKLKSSPAREDAAVPLANLNSEREVSEYRKQQQELRDACEYYATTGYPELDAQGKPVLDEDGNAKLKYTPRQLAEIKVRALRALENDIPKREAFLRKRAEFDAETVTRYPWLKNDSSKAAQEVSRIRENWQSIANGPGLTRLIVWALRGRDLEYRENDSRKTAPAEKPPQQPTKPAAERPAPTSKDSKKSERQAAASAAIRSGKGGTKALEEYLAAETSED